MRLNYNLPYSFGTFQIVNLGLDNLWKISIQMKHEGEKENSKAEGNFISIFPKKIFLRCLKMHIYTPDFEKNNRNGRKLMWKNIKEKIFPDISNQIQKVICPGRSVLFLP